MQGDCLSAVLFIYYLAKSLQSTTSHDDHPYCTRESTDLGIHPKYADDITFTALSETTINNIKESTTLHLESYNLQVNPSKTEQYIIPKPKTTNPTQPKLMAQWSELDWLLFPPQQVEEPKDETPAPDWKNCKLLGTILHTDSDIKRRKMLTNNALHQLKHIFNSRRISNQLKIRTFNTYCGSIFLYNSETWTLTSSLTKTIDEYHRKLQRYALGIYYPKIITNQNLQKITKAEPWSITIKRRRLNWFGHMMRLPRETPVKQALHEFLKPTPVPVGRPIQTWLNILLQDIQSANIQLNIFDNLPEDIIDFLETLTNNRNLWRRIVHDAMKSSSLTAC